MTDDEIVERLKGANPQRLGESSHGDRVAVQVSVVPIEERAAITSWVLRNGGEVEDAVILPSAAAGRLSVPEDSVGRAHRWLIPREALGI